MCESTLADEALGNSDAALVGDGEGDAGHHSVGPGQGIAEQRAQALGSGQPLAHVGDVGAALAGWHDVGVPAGGHARHHLEDIAPGRCVGRDHHVRRHEQDQARRCSCDLELHGVVERDDCVAQCKQSKNERIGSEWLDGC